MLFRSIRVKGSSSNSMSFNRQMGGGGGGGGTSTGAGGGGGGCWIDHPFALNGASASWNAYITIGAGGAVNTNGSGTLVPGIPGAGGGGAGGSPGSKPGKVGSDNPGYPNTAGSGGGACSWQTPSSGIPGGAATPTSFAHPDSTVWVYRQSGGLGKDAWWTHNAWGGYYAGGGGGGSAYGSPDYGVGGAGGGGNGGDASMDGIPGTDYTGGGGGGAQLAPQSSGAGGKGIVIIKYII